MYALRKIISSYWGKPLIDVEFLFIYNTSITLGAFNYGWETQSVMSYYIWATIAKYCSWILCKLKIIYCSQFWKLGHLRSRGCSSSVWWGPSFWSAVSLLHVAFSHGIDRKRERERERAYLSSYKDTDTGLPHSSVGEESACNAGDPSSIPGSERPTGEGIGYPLQYSGLENSTDRTV